MLAWGRHSLRSRFAKWKIPMLFGGHVDRPPFHARVIDP